jgi:DNA-binding NtrC family response regulator
LERAIILSTGDILQVADFQLEAQPNPPGSLAPPKTPRNLHSDEMVGDSATNHDLNLERLEKRTIQTALKQHRYNISHAARELGLTRAALYRRMEKYGL